MSNSLPRNAEQLLALVRYAFHGIPMPEEEIRWHELFHEACKQNIAANLHPAAKELMSKCIAANPDCFAATPIEGEGPVPLMKLVLGLWDIATEKTIQRSHVQFSLLYRLAKMVEPAGIGLMVLKGYGFSANYPNPMFRFSNDVDIYPFDLHNPDQPDGGRSAKRVDAIVREQLGVEVTGEHSDHHSCFSIDGIEVENHFKVIGGGKSRQAQSFEQHMQQLALDHTIVAKKDDVKVYIPSVKFNALHQLRHDSKHFANRGINIRHLLDWAFLVASPRFQQAKEENWQWLYPQAEKYNMHKFLAILNAICIEDLGFSADLFPVLPYNAKLKARVLQAIVAPAPHDKPHSFETPFHIKFLHWMRNDWKRRVFADIPIPQAFFAHVRAYINSQRAHRLSNQ